jgi:hypothetical protein
MCAVLNARDHAAHVTNCGRRNHHQLSMIMNGLYLVLKTDRVGSCLFVFDDALMLCQLVWLCSTESEIVCD